MTRRIHIAPAEFGGDEIALRGERAHRLSAVLRLRRGDALRVFDGAGHERAATVASATRRTVTLRLGEALETAVESPVTVTLHCAFPRGDRGGWIVEKATELGVTRIVLIDAERGVMQPGAGRIERWRRVAIEAAEQCGRAVVPEIVASAVARTADGDGVAIVADEQCADEGCPAISAVLSGIDPTSLSKLAIFIGPEGGWSDAERQAHERAERVRVSLGPRVLRVDTAAVVALAQVMTAIAPVAGGRAATA